MTPPHPPPTDRLAFRVWHEDDEPLAQALWGDERVTSLFDARGRLDERAVRDRLHLEIANQRDWGVQYWPLFARNLGVHVGACGLRPRDAIARVYEIGFHLRPEWWRKSLAVEAARTVIEFAFGARGASALFAGHHPKNEPSRGTLLALGFEHTHDEYYTPTGLDHPSYLLRAESWSAAP